MSGMILSVDIGTSSLKAALIDLDGKLRAFSRAAYPAGSGVVCAEDWEHAFARTVENLHSQAPGCVIDAICVSGNGPTLVPLGENGEALPPLYWNGGKTLLPSEEKATSFFLPHAAWFKKNSPEEYEKTVLFMSTHEWLAARLGAEAATVLPSKLYEPYYWDDEQCRLFGVDRNKFPPFVKMGSVMGKVSPDAARLFASCPGLKSGIPIIAGGPDFITALIGTDAARPGDVCDRAGTSEGINVCAAGQMSGAAVKDFRVLPHAVDGFWNVGAVIPASGKLFERYRIETGQENRAYGELLEELISHSPPDKPLDERTVRGREVLYAIAMSVRAALESLALTGFPVKEMRVSGGQGKNPLWNQFKADITGVKLMIPEIHDGELAGNAVLAAMALDGSTNQGKTGLVEMMNQMIRVREIFTPNAETAPFWETQYRLYKDQSS